MADNRLGSTPGWARLERSLIVLRALVASSSVTKVLGFIFVFSFAAPFPLSRARDTSPLTSLVSLLVYSSSAPLNIHKR